MCPETDQPLVYRAKWILPIVSPPLRDAWVQVCNGEVMCLGTGKPPGPHCDLGDSALLPALVNAHTHFEFSDLGKPLGQPGNTLPVWIQQVIAHRRAQDLQPRERVQAILAGMHESHRCGVGLAGEIATFPWLTQISTTETMSSLSTSAMSLHVMAFSEVLGLTSETQRTALQWGDACCEWIEKYSTETQSTCLHMGLSPHAPYSTPLPLVEACIARSRKSNLPVAMHLAESLEELELLENQSGPFRDMLENLHLWDPAVFPEPSSVIDYLQVLSLADHALVVHGNYLTDFELNFIAEHENLTVVYCPRTHNYFGHAPYPIERMLQRGIRIALGTDSRASNPDLNIWREAMEVSKQFPSVAPREILRMVSINGADAMGLTDHGRIQLGAIANFAVLPAKSEHPDSLLEELLHHQFEPRIFP